jgi:SAM-dependent methyltransferase
MLGYEAITMGISIFNTKDWKPIPRFIFYLLYRFYVPWDIGRVQPAIVELEERGEISGKVLDVGCGWGETTLFLAQKGYDVRGVDLVPSAVEKARSRAIDLGLKDLFFVHDVLELHEVNEDYDTVIDVGLFHTLSDKDRRRYVSAMSSVMKESGKLFMLCFSSMHTGFLGPRRISQEAVFDLFSQGWEVDYIRQARYHARFPRGGADAWLVAVHKVQGP